MAKQNYYLLGAVWDGYKQNDQSMRFIENGIWENGYNNKFIDVVKAVEVGARVAIKSKFTRGKCHQTSATRIKIVGTVTENPQDGITLKIKWDDNFEEFDFDGGGYLKTISRVRNKKYIDKVFFRKKQHIESRISRLTWNTKSWRMPSGKEGKSISGKTYENQHGFGHEEWLFDMEKIIDGYHYGFLEPIHKQYDAYKGNLYNVWLYTINGESQKRYWIGDIKELQVLQEEESQYVHNKYRQKGWLVEMQQQLKNFEFDYEKFSIDTSLSIFNIKFRPENLILNYPSIELPQNHPVQRLSRYSFCYFDERFREINNDLKSDFIYFELSRCRGSKH